MLLNETLQVLDNVLESFNKSYQVVFTFYSEYLNEYVIKAAADDEIKSQ